MRRAILVTAVAVALGVFGVAAFRELGAGARGVEACDRALGKREWASAIAAARDAAEATLPGSPYPLRGYARLERIAKDAEARADDATAADAWRAMRAATLATSGLGVRSGDWRRIADEGLLRVAAHDSPHATTGAQVTDAPADDTLASALAREDTPPTGTFVLLGLGAAAFFGALFRLAWLAGESLDFRRARLPLAVAVVGAAAYAVATLRG